MALLYRILRDKWISPPQDSKESYEGRNVIVTGATSGIGLEAAVKFANLGAPKVIIAARDLGKGAAVKADIEARTGKKDVLEVWELDMNSYDSVVAFAKRAESLEHLDVAILNAGIRRGPFVQSKHGWEEDIQVNTLSTVLLAILLIPKLKQSKRPAGKIPILEFVNSGLHENATIDPEVIKSGKNILEAYNTPELFTPGSQYAITKLFLMFATNKLAANVSSGEVLITSICPGLVGTDLGRDVKFPGVKIVLAIVYAIVMKTPEQGSRVIVRGARQDEVLHGRFLQMENLKPVAPSIAGDENKKIGLQVWDEIVETLSKDVPSVREILPTIAKN